MMPIDTEQWRANIGLFCASRVLLQPPRCKQPQPEVQADTLSLNMRFTLAVLLVTLRTGVVYASRILQLLWLITCHACWLLSSIIKGSRRRLRGVSVLLALCLVVVPMLLIMSGDVEENPGPLKMQTSSLGLSYLHCVREELLDISHKWFDIGLMLELNVGTLECVRKQFPEQSTALREMLLCWLKKVDPPPTWEGLACALETRTVGEPRLAEQLRTKHCSSRKRKKEQPHCDIPGENWEIVDKFSVALEAIEDSLAVEPCKLKAYLGRLCHPLKPDKPYVKSRHYESAATTSEIIQSLFPKFINYQNTGLLRQIVLRFGCDKCKAALQEYLQHYSTFSDKKLCNVPNAVSDEELDWAMGVKRLRVETNKELKECGSPNHRRSVSQAKLKEDKLKVATVADIKTVQNAVGKATGIDPDFISPAQHGPGSLILTFLVPESVCEIFCELCEDDLEILANCGVTRLQIEDCVIENVQKHCTNTDREKDLIDDPDITAKGIDLVLLLKKKVLQCTQYAHLVNLLAAIPQEDMHRVCSINVLQRLAPTISNWIDLAPYLGITGSTVQQIELQYPSMEEQSYQALLQWKELYQDSATHESLVEFLVRHAPLSTVETALTIIIPATLARHILQQAYLAPRSGCLWHGAPMLMEFSQRLGRGLENDLCSDLDLLAVDYSSRIEDFPAVFEVVSVKSFLNAVSRKQQRLFSLIGPHGSGKTVLLQRACSLWARGLCWRKFTLVLWVDMKALAIALASDPQYTFKKFLQYVVPEGTDVRDFCDWMDMHDGENILLVLDGVDSFTTTAFLDSILSEPSLRKGSIIITSSSPHQSFSMKWSQYYLLGLSEDQITRQVINFYSDSTQKAEDFLSFVFAAPAIKTLCSNPPCLAAVLSVFDSGYPGDLPATWTQLFKQLILLFIRQHPTLDQSAMDQPILQQLAQWTFDEFCHHGGVLPEPLRPFFSMGTPPYTISVKPAVNYDNFSLPWLTSNYLAAIHIHTLPLEKQADLMKSQRFGDCVWRFFAGLCSSVNDLNRVLANFCHRNTIEYATCIHEARNVSSHKVKKQKLTVEKTLMSSFETHVVLSVAQSSNDPFGVTVKAMFLGAGGLTEIGKCLTADSILGTGGIEELSLSGETGGFIRLQDLQEVKVFARGLAVNCTLKTLIVENTGVSAEGASALASALCVNHSLKQLDLTGIPDAGVSALAGALRVNQSLEKLGLSLTGISDERVSALAEALRVNQSLEKLGLSLTGISGESVSALAEALRVNQSLEKLGLGLTGVSAKGASALISALCVNHRLKELSLGGNKVTDVGVFALALALRVKLSLEKLDLELTGVSPEGASALARALCVNHSLKELNLQGTGLSDERSSALARLLCGKHHLKVINLSGNKMTDAVVFYLAGALRVNQSLEKLDLSDVDLSAEGASALASALFVNHSLKVLILGAWIRYVGVAAVAGVLKMNQSLEKLVLRLTDLSAERVSTLACALCDNHSLKELDFSLTKMPNAGIFALSRALRVNRSLEKLQIGLYPATDRAVSELADALEVNNSLRKLQLGGVSGRMQERLRSLAERKGIDIKL